MIGRKGLIGLSLLCALASYAFGAANASAAGTTAFTCVEKGGKEDFEDAHCDDSVGTGKGEYGHVAIATGSPTTITGTNDLTGSPSSWKLKGTIGGTSVEITCETIHVHGSLENVVGPPMAVTGEGTLSSSGCMLMKPEAQTTKCAVTVEAATSTSETKNMEMVFKPKTGGRFTEITLANAAGQECAKALKGGFAVEGSATATGLSTGELPNQSGATLHFTTADTASTLTFAGHPAELEGTLTVKKAPKEGEEEKPVVATTDNIGTTAFRCAEQRGEEDFEDAHCDTNVGSGKGGYGHVAISTETPVTGTNDLTGSPSSWKLKGTIGGTSVEITCGSIHVHGSLNNNAGPPMKVTGEGTLNATSCMLMTPAEQTSNCTVLVGTTTSTSETTGMEVKFVPKVGTTFGEITLAGATCPKTLQGTFAVEGSANATGLSTEESPAWSGATLHFTTADTASTLTFAGHAAELEGTLSFKLAPKEGEEEDPIVATTEDVGTTGTTAVTCEEHGGEEDFEDAHCDNSVGTGKGEYGHVAIATGSPTTITGTNDLTGSPSSWKLKGTIGGTSVEITCETIHVHGSLENVVGPPMAVTGEGTLNASNCMLMVPATQTSNCTVTVGSTTSTSEAVNGEMKMLVAPTGATFTTITIADATEKTCPKALKGGFTVEGSANATGLSTTELPSWSGATLHFTTADTKATLIFAGHPAELEGALTFKMAPIEGEEENPIVGTTE